MFEGDFAELCAGVSRHFSSMSSIVHAALPYLYTCEKEEGDRGENRKLPGISSATHQGSAALCTSNFP